VNIDHKTLIDIFGDDNVSVFYKQSLLLDLKQVKIEEISELRERAAHVYDVDLTFTDIAVSASAGVLLGIANALFKDFIPKSGALKHEHITKRTAIDYKTPTYNDLHRQIGPSHDIFRFKETLRLISGEQTDFKLWGSSINKILGSGNPAAEMLRAQGMSVKDFTAIGGFRIPVDPKAELLHHLMIDFFTSRSLPIPGTTFIADQSRDLAKIMTSMYDDGFNLKNLSGNFLGFTVLQLIIHGYVFLFKALPASGVLTSGLSKVTIASLISQYKQYTHSNEFHVLMMLAHGSSFLLDTLITTGSKNYAGLFQLNYASLMMFGKHLLSYMIDCHKEYRQLMEKIKDKAIEIDDLNEQWYGSFKSRFLNVATDSGFIEFIDPQAIMDSHNRLESTIEKRKDLNKSMHDALLLLKEQDNG